MPAPRRRRADPARRARGRARGLAARRRPGPQGGPGAGRRPASSCTPSPGDAVRRGPAAADAAHRRAGALRARAGRARRRRRGRRGRHAVRRGAAGHRPGRRAERRALGGAGAGRDRHGRRRQDVGGRGGRRPADRRRGPARRHATSTGCATPGRRRRGTGSTAPSGCATSPPSQGRTSGRARCGWWWPASWRRPPSGTGAARRSACRWPSACCAPTCAVVHARLTRRHEGDDAGLRGTSRAPGSSRRSSTPPAVEDHRVDAASATVAGTAERVVEAAGWR